ncbi:MAG: hypothetical protein LBU43_04630 [Candidatus Accumulibacter sp.]|jgi:hypothetical protein|nr:hypothetical protein [Accumulibacter sp.]
MNARSGDGSAGNPATPPKRRSFLATRQDQSVAAEALLIKTQETDPLPLSTPSTLPVVTVEDDIPILTEIVPVEKKKRETPVIEKAPPELPTISGNVSLEEFAARMSLAIEEQMAYELPTLVEAALFSVSEELRKGIASTMEVALRDFTTHYKPAPPSPDEQPLE